MAFDINQLNVKGDFTYYVNPKHSIDFGASSILYKLHPGSFVPNGPESLVAPNISAAEQALESAVYAGDRYEINKKLSISAGIRFSRFDNMGPASVNVYAQNLPKDDAVLLKLRSTKPGRLLRPTRDLRFA
jgi:outer membrane receptor for monomeric catechols